MQVFISYKSKYRDFAQRLRDTLRGWGYETWLDVDNIPEGTYFRHEIQKGLEGSQIVIGIMTPEAFESRDVMWEWDYALYNSRFIPLKYLESKLPYHLQGTQYVDFTQNEAQAFEHLRHALTSPAAKPLVRPAAPIPAKSRDDKRARVLTKVRENWIQGVLDNELRDSPFELGMELKPDAVLKHVDYDDYVLPNTSGILDLFDDMGSELLILGAPGAGKTMLMLQLAEKLLERANTDESEPIPVIFNLASWAEKRQPLKDWLVERLFLEYQVPRKVGQRWLENESLLLLMDGLDEVKEEVRSECVDAINAFRRQHPNMDIVVCSRILDYELLTSRLNLQSAITLQPLTEKDVEKSLEPAEFIALHDAVTAEPALRALAATPFLMNTMLTTYRGASKGDIPPFKDEISWLHDLFEKCIFKHFRQKPREKYTLLEMNRWLSWLARKMVKHDQKIFYIENLQPWWLETQCQKSAYAIVVRFPILIFGIFILNFVSYIGGNLMVGFIGGVLGTIFVTLLNPIKRRDRFINMWKVLSIIGGGQLIMVIFGGIFGGIISLVIDVILGIWNLREIQTIMINGVISGINGGLISGIFTGFVAAIIASGLGHEPEITTTERLKFSPKDYRVFITPTLRGITLGIVPGALISIFGNLIVGFKVGLIITSVTSFIFLIISRVENDDIAQTPRPNQRMFLSLRTAIMLLASCFFGFFIFFSLLLEPRIGLIVGLVAGIGVSWTYGGNSCISHSMIRFLIACGGYAPLNYARFLDFCASISIMRKVGGGYIFQHRMLLEYFAGLYEVDKQN